MIKQFLRNNLIVLLLILSANTLVAQDVFTNGVIEYNNKNYKDAAKAFEQFISTNPFEVAPYEYLVNCYIELSENDKAIELIKKTNKKFPTNTNLKKTLGKLYVNKMQFSKAEKTFLEVLKIEPTNQEIKGYLAKIYFNMAVFAFQKNDFKTVIKKLDTSLKYDDNNKDVYALKANSLIQLKKFEEAKKVIAKGLKKFPNNDQLLIDNSLILISQEKYSEAITKLKPVWKRNKNNLQIGLQLARLYRIKNKIEEAFAIYDSLLKKYPKERKVYDEMLDYFTATGKLEEKRKIYKKMEEVFPNDKELTLSKIKTYVLENEDSTAIAGYFQFVNNNPKLLKGYIELGKLYNKNAMYEDGIALMNKALANKQNQKEIYFYLGKFYSKNNQLKLSLETYLKYSKLKPNDYQAYYEIGSIYLEQNKLDLAKLNFEKAIKLNKNDALSFAKISKVHRLQGDKENAERYYVKSFVKNIIALQQTQQMLLGSINESKNIAEVEVDDESENLELYQDNIDEADKYLVANLSNTKYLEMINRLLKHYTQSALLLYYKALYYERTNNYKLALKYYERVISRSSKVEKAHIRMAEIYYKQGNIKQTILAYKRALSLSNNREIYKRLTELYREDNRLNTLCNEWLNIYAAQPDNKLLEEYLIIALHKAGRIEEAKEIINKSE